MILKCKTAVLLQERVMESDYRGPEIAACYLHKYKQQYCMKEMIDIGAGTGLVAAQVTLKVYKVHLKCELT